ncbi:MAG TPA: hypothetical protein DC042_15005 [Bacteroidales bacterium]|nr:hypothetical protein [Bacteroidales bacterium]
MVKQLLKGGRHGKKDRHNRPQRREEILIAPDQVLVHQRVELRGGGESEALRRRIVGKQRREDLQQRRDQAVIVVKGRARQEIGMCPPFILHTQRPRAGKSKTRGYCQNA